MLNTCWLSVTTDAQPESKGETLERLHQEDFCQALGIVSENKYQKKAGRRSSSASLCCARSPARRSSTWRACWTQ